ncbi:Dihydroorotate dehydrogenase-domain-containing protein [Geopyxis carbonaria]|nr:Dihydroorotate dehydrogenase-domain-containing protein [Geopyxis carbonaria]
MPLLRPHPTVLRAARATLRPALPHPHPHPRFASSAALRSPVNRVRNGVYGTLLLGAIAFGVVEATDTRSALHRYTVPSLLRLIFSGDDVSAPGPEAAHTFGLRALALFHALGLPLRERGTHPYLPHLRTTLFGHTVNTPLGISAGLDKHGEAIDALYTLSPAISMLEIGCVTPLPQPGNPLPRVFRLPSSQGMINRYGFNSAGADAVARRLRDRVRRYAREHNTTEEAVLADPSTPASLLPGRILAVQIGKNKSTSEKDIPAVTRDYVTCVQKLGRYADVVVVNVSSPNTPGLRSLQAADPLTTLLSAVVAAAAEVPRARTPAVVVKVSPDSDSKSEIDAICDAIRRAKVAGVIVANTTVTRPELLLQNPKITDVERRTINETGGLSGPALLPRTLRLVGEFRNRLGSGVEVIASGGIGGGVDAWSAVERGASGVMAYTGMVYGGVGWFGRAAQELAELSTAARRGV